MNSIHNSCPYCSDTMAEQPPLTDHFFATEEESNITNNINNWVFPIPMDQPPPSPVAQEAARPNQETDQLVCTTPHRLRWRMEDGEMVCVALAPSPLTTPHCTQHLLPLTPMRERRRVLLEDFYPLPVQATTHHGGCPDLLVCPPLPRNGRAEMWLHRVDMVSGTVIQIPANYDDRSEVVCNGVGWGRRARNPSHQTSHSTEPSSKVENNLGATDTHGHTTHHYVPLLLPLETANVCVLIAPNVNCSHPCEDGEVERAHNSAVPLEGGGCNMITENPTPPTQQFVSGRIVSCNDLN